MSNAKVMPPLFNEQAGLEIISGWRGKVRLVATDVDGTLTVEGPEVPPSLRGTLAPEAFDVIRSLVLGDVPIVLVSGRPLATIEGLGMYLGLVDRGRTEFGCPMIAENGAVFKFGGGIFELAEREAVEAEIEAMKRDGLLPEAGFLSHDNYLRICDAGLDSTVVDPAVVAQRLASRPELGLKTFTSNIMTHIVQAHVSKAAALADIAARIGVPEDAIAVFGDSATDISLFERFPVSVCVSNYFETVADWQSQPLSAVRSAKPGGAGFAEVASAIFL